MSSIIDQIQCTRMDERKPLYVGISCTPDDAGPLYSAPPEFAEKYKLELNVGVYFWANKAQMSAAKANAEKLILQELHKDILGHSAKLQHAIYGQDLDEALRLAVELPKLIGL